MPTSFAILVWNNKSRHGSVFPHNPRICSQKTIINGKNLPYNLWVTSSWSVYARECNPQKTTNFWEKRLKHLKRHVNTQFSQTPNFFWEFEFLGIYIYINTQTKSFLQSWLRKHFVRLRYKYAKKRVDKGVFIERKGFQSWLKAASRKWQFPLCLRCPPRWRKTMHLGIQLIFENGSMGL